MSKQNWVWKKSAPRLDLGLEACRRIARLRLARRIGAADKQPRRRCEFPPAGENPIVPHGADRRHELVGLEVEHRLRLRLIAGVDRIAGEAEQAVHAERRPPQHVGLQRQAVAVAHGELQHRLDAFAGEDRRRRERREMGARARAVEHVDGVGETLEASRVGQNVGRIHRIGRPHLRRDGELARAQHAFQPARALRLVRHRSLRCPHRPPQRRRRP